jgi:hypothetical protein
VVRLFAPELVNGDVIQVSVRCIGGSPKNRKRKKKLCEKVTAQAVSKLDHVLSPAETFILQSLMEAVGVGWMLFLPLIQSPISYAWSWRIGLMKFCVSA